MTEPRPTNDEAASGARTACVETLDHGYVVHSVPFIKHVKVPDHHADEPCLARPEDRIIGLCSDKPAPQELRDRPTATDLATVLHRQGVMCADFGPDFTGEACFPGRHLAMAKAIIDALPAPQELRDRVAPPHVHDWIEGERITPTHSYWCCAECGKPGPHNELDANVERLRKQNHEHAERRDREQADLHHFLDRWENAAKRARELVRGSPVDWTDDPPSKEPDGWWLYTSQNNRDILTTAVHDLLGGSDAAQRVVESQLPTDAASEGIQRVVDYEQFRMDRGWPTPNHMRRTADALDVFTPAKYGDVLRWFADLCDAALDDRHRVEGQPAPVEDS